MTDRGTAVVVGGRGVIGAGIATALRARGWNVEIASSRPAARAQGHRYADLLDATTLEPALEGADIVVQSANFPNYPFEKPSRRWTFMEFDGLGTERLVRAAEAVGAQRYLFISGVGVTDYPTKPYYQALKRGEEAVMNSSIASVALRPAFVFGPNDNGINKLVRWSRGPLPALPLPNNGNQMHQPVYVDDVGTAAADLLATDAPTGVFEIGGPERMTMRDMIERAFSIIGVRQPIVSVPTGLATSGANILGRLPGPLLTRGAMDFVLENFIAENGPVLAATSVRLTSLEEGLRTYCHRLRM